MCTTDYRKRYGNAFVFQYRKRYDHVHNINEALAYKVIKKFQYRKRYDHVHNIEPSAESQRMEFQYRKRYDHVHNTKREKQGITLAREFQYRKRYDHVHNPLIRLGKFLCR